MSVTDRKKLFIENFLAYGVINALDKIVPLIMLPIVTRLIRDTADYGRFEMFNTIVGFGSSFAILGVYDAMFREYFEKEDDGYKNLVTSTALRIVCMSGLITSGALILFSRYVSKLFLGDSNSWMIVIFAAIGVFLSALRAIISAPTRMKNQRKVYVFSGVSYSLIYYLSAIFFIRHGLSYSGLVYGNLIASTYVLIFFYILNRFDFDITLFDKNALKELLKIGIPLVPVFIIYWAFQSMDKIMILNMIGIDQVGIYSIGAKVASVSTFIYAAFAGGWQYFAFRTMKDEDQVELTSKIFEYLGILSYITLAIVILFDNFVFDTLFAGDYAQGVTVFPYLFLSPLVLMLFQTAGNQLLVIKKTYVSTICLICGLVANLILNYLLIPKFGIKGAAIATLTGYILSVIFMLIVTEKLMLIKISFRFKIASGVTLLVLVCIFFDVFYASFFTPIILMTGILLYKKDILHLYNKHK